MELKTELDSNADCHAAALLSAVSYAAVILLPAGDLGRAVLAIPFLVFCPGYLAAAALFYNKRLDPVIHAVLGVGLSVCIVATLGLALGSNPASLGIRAVPAATSIFFLCIFLYCVRIIGVRSAMRTERKLMRRRKESYKYRPERHRVAALHVDYSPLRMDAAFAAVLAVALVAGGYAVYTVARDTALAPGPPASQRWSELYLLSTNSSSPLVIPSNASLAKNFSVVVKVVNKEKEAQDYIVTGSVGVVTPAIINREVFRQSVTMSDGQSLEWNVSFAFITTGKNTVTFSLYREGKFDREVHAVINVK